jgi:hypothetical protein
MICPNCLSENTETITEPDEEGACECRCLDCGEEWMEDCE